MPTHKILCAGIPVKGCNIKSILGEQVSALWQEAEERLRTFGELARRTVEAAWLVKDTGMTRARAWLLADGITCFSVQASVTCALFRGSAKTHILDRKAFRGNLHDIYHEVITYIQAG